MKCANGGAEVSPEPGGVLDRDRAREVIETALRWKDHPDPPSMDVYLDRLAGGVRPAAIDRDALWAIFNDEDVWDQGYPHVIDRIVALVRPAAGVMLTPEEAALAAYAVRGDLEAEDFGDNAELERNLRALAARLEAAS